MNIEDNIARWAKEAWDGIKNTANYVGQWLHYIVTLGNAEYPRYKDSASQTQIMPHVISMADRAVATENIKQKQADDFLNFLKNNFGEKMAGEFKESKAYSDFFKDTNPFATIGSYYQKYSAETFLNALEAEARNNFIKSEEYKDFLKRDLLDMNPFSETYGGITIEESYQKYLNIVTEKLKARADKFEKQAYDFFVLEEDPVELEIKESFRDSPAYQALLNKLKTDIEFSLTLDGIRIEYEKYKNDIKQENDRVLNNFLDKNKFIKSLEYRGVSQKVPLLPKNLEEAYNRYTTRLQQEKDFEEYMKELKLGRKFVSLESSEEYRGVTLVPENLERLKSAVRIFEFRNFKENIPEEYKEFLIAEPYKGIIENPFSSIREVEEAYKKYVDERNKAQEQEGEQYLEDLKAKLKKETGADGYYNKFINSAIYVKWSVRKRREDLENAFEEFKRENPRTWSEWFWGS